MPGTTEALALVLLGLLQPFAQELLLRGKLSGLRAELATWAFSIALALAAAWVTGAFGWIGSSPPPAFSWSDPSAYLAYWSVRLTPVRLLAATIYQAYGARVHKLAGTT